MSAIDNTVTINTISVEPNFYGAILDTFVFK